MARIRTVKPEFWSSEQILDCSPIERLLFIGLWNFCDDAGRIPFSPKSIKAKVFPGDDISVDEISSIIRRLIDAELLEDYTVENKRYLQVTGWKKHQKIDRPNPKYPGPDETTCGPRRTLDEGSPPEGKGRESKGKENNRARASKDRQWVNGHGDADPFEAQVTDPPGEAGRMAAAYRAIMAEVFAVVGWVPNDRHGDRRQLNDWAASGWDAELFDRFIRQHFARAAKSKPTALKYFAAAIAEYQQTNRGLFAYVGVEPDPAAAARIAEKQVADAAATEAARQELIKRVTAMADTRED